MSVCHFSLLYELTYAQASKQQVAEISEEDFLSFQNQKGFKRKNKPDEDG